MKKQNSDLKIINEVMSEAFNEKLDAKEKELEKIKKEKSKSEKDHNIVLKEIKEELT